MMMSLYLEQNLAEFRTKEKAALSLRRRFTPESS